MNSNIMVLVYKSTLKQKCAKIYPEREYILNFDSCSKGNPGASGIGIVIYKDKNEIWASSQFIGNKTINESEYCALINGLEFAIDMNIKDIIVCGNSLLVINQVNGLYKVRASNLLQYYEKVVTLKKKFNNIEIIYVPREVNKRADQLANLALNTIDYNYNSNFIESKDNEENF